MTSKAVTTAQLEQVRKMAKEKGVGRKEFQDGLDNRVIAGMLYRLSIRPDETSPLVEIDAIQLPAVDRFVIANHFMGAKTHTIDAGGNLVSGGGGIRFFLGDNFEHLFFGKTEMNVPSCLLKIYRFRRNSSTATILTELGKRAETSFAHLFKLLSGQNISESGNQLSFIPPIEYSHGKSGTQLTLADGFSTIFYIKGADGNLRVVDVSRSSIYDGWHISGHTVESRSERPSSCQVVAHG